MNKNSSALVNFEAVLQKQGLEAGLAFLNGRVPHRYTSVYRLEHDFLRRLVYVDKSGSADLALAEVPFKDSFCEVAIEEGALVVTDSASDARVQRLPNPAELASYVGLPLADAPGGLFGSFCHYDVCSQPLSDEEFEFLEDAAKVLHAYVAQHSASGGSDTSAPQP